MFGCILNRMIFWEMVKVFVLCLIGITGILLIAGIVAEASQQGLNPAQILAIIPLLIPSTLPYTIPATTLFATCVVYGRLSADNEILAIRASGISLLKVVWPALLVGLLTSAATLTLYYRIIPYTHHLMRSMFLGDVEELLYAMLKKHNQIAYPNFDYAMYVKSVQGRRLIDTTFKHKDNEGEIDAVVRAQEAELRVDLKRQMILVRMQRGSAWARNDSIAFFEERPWEIPLPENLNPANYHRARDMTWEEILDNLAAWRAQEEELTLALEQGKKEQQQNPPPDAVNLHIQNLEQKIKSARAQVLSLEAELQMRPALALGCFCFVLVGCPVGVWFSRSDYLSSFITCFLPIVFIYYPLLLCGTGLAKTGRFDPVLTIWVADAVMGVVGLVLFWRLLRN